MDSAHWNSAILCTQGDLLQTQTEAWTNARAAQQALQDKDTELAAMRAQLIDAMQQLSESECAASGLQQQVITRMTPVSNLLAAGT